MTRANIVRAPLLAALLPAFASAQGAEHKSAGPGPDFPSLDSFYPMEARRLGEEGVATVHFCVNASGMLTESPRIVSSSGNEALDAAALELANAGSGHYAPATENGVAVQGCAAFNVAFRLRAKPAKAPQPGPDFPNLEEYYPLEARIAGQEGAAVIHFCVDKAGALTETPTIAASSGNTVLDGGAVTLATAGSGHYLPASAENGTPMAGCGKFRVAFKLGPAPEILPSDPRFPTISARAAKLGDEFNRRMEGAMTRFGPNARPVLVPTYPDTASTIRQYARAAESALDDGTAIVSDFLEDMDYLGKSADIPKAERTAFNAVWPARRAVFMAQMREVLGACRDLVRLTDELADYIALQHPEPAGGGPASLESLMTNPDPQIAAIQARARTAGERLKAAVLALGSDTAPQ